MELKQLLVPNAVLSRQAMMSLIVAEIVTTFVVWTLYPSVFFPKPMEIIEAFGRLLNDAILLDIASSFMLNLESLAITVIISLVFAYSSRLPVMKPVVAFLSKLRFNSLVGLSFFFVLWTTGGHELKLSLLVFGMSTWFITSMSAVIRSIPDEEYEHARTLGMGEWRVTWEVVVLGRLDEAWEIMRQIAAMGWMMLTMVEGIVRSDGGIGVALLNQNKYLHLDAVFAIQSVQLLIAIGQDYLLGTIKKVLFPYSQLGKE